jgi:hypothetical protein
VRTGGVRLRSFQNKAAEGYYRIPTCFLGTKNACCSPARPIYQLSPTTLRGKYAIFSLRDCSLCFEHLSDNRCMCSAHYTVRETQNLEAKCIARALCEPNVVSLLCKGGGQRIQTMLHSVPDIRKGCPHSSPQLWMPHNTRISRLPLILNSDTSSKG